MMIPGQSPSSRVTVRATHLVKTYDHDVTAIQGVSLHASRGEIIGVVGPNGAGKSTTLNILATLIRRTSGTAEICGISVDARQQVREIIGVALQEAGLDPLMNANDHFDIQGSVYGVTRRDIVMRRELLLDQFELSSVAGRSVGLYSGGMQRRLALALALVSDPQVVIFDEPTSGLDPASRRVVWRCIAELREQDKTVIFSTHYLEEAQELCDRVYLIFDGRVVREGTPDTVRSAAGVALLKVSVRAPRDTVTAMLAAMTGDGIVGSRVAVEEPLTVEFNLSDGGSGTTERILSEMRKRQIEVHELRLASPSLEDAFLAMVDETPSAEGGCPVRRGSSWRRSGVMVTR